MHQRQRNVASKADSLSEGIKSEGSRSDCGCSMRLSPHIISGSFQTCEMRFSAASISVLFPGGALGPGGAVDRRLPGRKYKLHLLHIQPGGAAQQVAAEQRQLLLCFCFHALPPSLDFLRTVPLHHAFAPCCQLAYEVKTSRRFLDASHIIGFKSDLEAAVHVLPLKKNKTTKTC